MTIVKTSVNMMSYMQELKITRTEHDIPNTATKIVNSWYLCMVNNNTSLALWKRHVNLLLQSFRTKISELMRAWGLKALQ